MCRDELIEETHVVRKLTKRVDDEWIEKILSQGLSRQILDLETPFASERHLKSFTSPLPSSALGLLWSAVQDFHMVVLLLLDVRRVVEETIPLLFF